ncbi:alpha/beta hydrolase [Thalassobaculum sp.]|uniref:alpha/beta fold hydrolase n=1 Tax=Thalassobaculum sp. TaxID=2022740 RepID=UPI0032EDA3CE
MAGFDDFEVRDITTSGSVIHLRVGGSGPAVLLLHGHPETHLMWRHLVPELARRFTVVAADLRGYGQSGKPPTTVDHAPYSKRSMALDMAEVMTALGHERFAVVGHDRGGRVAHRLARDHRDRVSKLAVLDICPTLDMYERTDMSFARAYYHWFFLIQPYDLPERMIGADPAFYLRSKLASSAAADVFPVDVVAEYLRHYARPETIHAICEDYRASAGIDLEHDRADRDDLLDVPILALWGSKGVVARTYDVLDVWRCYTTAAVSGAPLPCGHFLPEEAPEATLAALMPFLES